MNVTTLGIDLAKEIFQVHGADVHGREVFSKQLKRKDLMKFIIQQKPCLIGLEACGGAHYWARRFKEAGHTVKMMSPQFVKPYVRSDKTDKNDARAIAEAVKRPDMKFVPIKTVEQQDMLLLHRSRELAIKHRTSLGNHIRGLLAEYGIVLPVGLPALRRGLAASIPDAENGLSYTARAWFNELYEKLKVIDAEVDTYDERLEEVTQKDERRQRLMEIEGIGPVSASALVASIGDAGVFKNGRQVSAWLGLVPKQHSSGGKIRLQGISKRGDGYLRKLLVHGGRSAIRVAKNKDDERSLWIQSLVNRIGVNKAAVAVANKNARIVWALLHRDEKYRKRVRTPVDSVNHVDNDCFAMLPT